MRPSINRCGHLEIDADPSMNRCGHPLFSSKSRANDAFIMICCAKVVNIATSIGPKWAHKQIKHIFAKDFSGSRGPRVRQSREQLSEPRGLGGGGGRVNLPPRRLVWRFWEVSRVCCWVTTSTRLEARGLGGLLIRAPYLPRATFFHAPGCLGGNPEAN